MRDDGRPRIKATQIRNSVDSIALIAPGRTDEVLAAMNPDIVQAIQSSVRTDWLPVEYDIALAETVEKVLGPGRDRERSRTATTMSMQTSLLKPVIDGIQKIFGLAPRPLIRSATRAWAQVYRNCGKPVFEDREGNSASLIYELPPVIAENTHYLRSIAGGLHACLDICKVEGTVEPSVRDREKGLIEFRFDWRTPA